MNKLVCYNLPQHLYEGVKSQRRWYVCLILFMLSFSLPVMAQEPDDTDRMEMAIAYFQSGKYHEALLLFEKLDKEYTLNPRFQGFMGVCYFHEWLYEEACRKLEAVMPQLEVFAPHERSVYYYTAGESHFELKQYAEAIPHYEKALTVCYDNEKGDINYRLGMCYMFLENWQAAYDHFEHALDYLIGFRDTPEMQARIKQTAHMMAGCKNRLKEIEHNRLATISDSIDNTRIITDSISQTPAEEAEEMIAGTKSEEALPTDTLTGTDEQLVPPIKPTEIMVGNALPEAASQVSSAPIQVVATEPVKRRVVKTQSEIPSTQNIEHVYEQKVEVKE